MEWIKVSKELPPHDKPFLGFGKDGLDEHFECVVMMWYDGGIDSEGYDSRKGYYALNRWGKYNNEWDCNPIFWMPLPEPPKE